MDSLISFSRYINYLVPDEDLLHVVALPLVELDQRRLQGQGAGPRQTRAYKPELQIRVEIHLN